MIRSVGPVAIFNSEYSRPRVRLPNPGSIFNRVLSAQEQRSGPVGVFQASGISRRGNQTAFSNRASSRMTAEKGEGRLLGGGPALKFSR